MYNFLIIVFLGVLGVSFILVPGIYEKWRIRRAYNLLQIGEGFVVDVYDPDPFNPGLKRCYRILDKKDGWIRFQVWYLGKWQWDERTARWESWVLLNNDAEQIINKILARDKHEKNISEGN